MDYLETNNRRMRFLFEWNKLYKRLFWFKYENDEFYFGSSLNPIICAGLQDIQDIIFTDTTFSIKINNALQQKKFDSLKFSFHASGVRHLKMRNSELKIPEQLYRKKHIKLNELEKPEMLFTILSKRISLYEDYKAKVTKNDTNAILLNTPEEYLKYRQVFEFYILTAPKQTAPFFMIQKDTPFEHLTIKLKDKIYLHIKYVINAADNVLKVTTYKFTPIEKIGFYFVILMLNLKDGRNIFTLLGSWGT